MTNQGPATAGSRLPADQALALCDCRDPRALARKAAASRDLGHGPVVSYSRKVFIPLTRLCRDVCRYCTFATSPRKLRQAYMSLEEVLAVARAGKAAGCREALFTLGDKPELRYAVARQELAALGHESTAAYLHQAAGAVLGEIGLLPHINAGVLERHDLEALRTVSASQGLMLESASERLCARGGPHFGSPDKDPRVRLDMIRVAGELAIPFTTGILIGIGETRQERVESLLAIRELHDRYGHLQEIIVQNFRPKFGTPMARDPAPSLGELIWTIAAARLIFGPDMNIQAPPNLSPGQCRSLIEAGINDWGGVSPVTPDHVNPEAPWPHLDDLARETLAAGKALTERLTIYPAFALDAKRWLAPDLWAPVRQQADADGFAWTGPWTAGGVSGPPAISGTPADVGDAAPDIREILCRAENGSYLAESEIVRLFQARHADFEAVCNAADRLRQRVNGDVVSYVVNRNINYTNICYFHCGFCAFSKGAGSQSWRGKVYDLDTEEIVRRAREAWSRGATELCMQGGIHPRYTGQTYLDICRAVSAAVPDMHLHAFSPLEIWQGAETLGIGVGEFLARLRGAGLATLPGTAAEVLDDEVRAILCPDKLDTNEWLAVMRAAHANGLKSTATIMFGHVDHSRHWARHLLRVRTLQAETGGFTEFVPLPFVHMGAPIYLRGQARRGPTFREAVLMHAVARLTLHPHIANIQASWVKMGLEGAEVCLRAGANDLGGTLMNESITRAAGGTHGQEVNPSSLEKAIRAIGRRPLQRTTLYGQASLSRRDAAREAPALLPMVNEVSRRERSQGSARPLVRADLSLPSAIE